MLSRRTFALGLMTQAAGLLPGELHAQEGMFLTEATAPAAVFPQATTFERTVVPSTPELRAQMQTQLGTLRPSLWEPEYIIFTAKQRDIAPRIRRDCWRRSGKACQSRSLSGCDRTGKVAEVAVMAYREPYGGEVRYPRF